MRRPRAQQRPSHLPGQIGERHLPAGGSRRPGAWMRTSRPCLSRPRAPPPAAAAAARSSSWRRRMPGIVATRRIDRASVPATTRSPRWRDASCPGTVPVMQAPIGPAATPALAAAVSAAGGHRQPGRVVDRAGAAARADPRRSGGLTDRPFCVNLVLAFDQAERLEVVRRGGRRARSRSRGGSTPELVARAHAAGCLVLVQAGSVAEAVAGGRAGCDAVIAQGVEAGGHVQGETPLLRAGRPGRSRGRRARDRRRRHRRRRGVRAAMAAGADGRDDGHALRGHARGRHASRVRRPPGRRRRRRHGAYAALRRRLAGRPPPRAREQHLPRAG